MYIVKWIEVIKCVTVTLLTVFLLHPGRFSSSYIPENPDSLPGITQTTILVVPYRNRPDQLATFLAWSKPFLAYQNLTYHIVIVEQSPGTEFNRAALFNAGFTEMTKKLKLNSSDQDTCFVFHDVDLVPQNPKNLYACPRSGSPVHLSANLETFRFNLPYAELFGGAIAIKADVFKRVNGFSNNYFGKNMFLIIVSSFN